MKSTWCTIFSVYSYLSGVQEHMLLHTRQLAIQNEKYQMAYKCSYSSWWWTRRDPKHVEVTNKTDELYWEYCAPSWFNLRNYTETNGEENIKCDSEFWLSKQIFPSFFDKTNNSRTKHCCYGNAIFCFLCIVVDLDVAVNDINPLNVVELQTIS
jgi:hypothetical protein